MPSRQPPAHLCFGDSGGPVVTAPTDGSAPLLAGISGHIEGWDCTVAFGSAIDLTAPEIRAFIDGSETPPMAPRLKLSHEAVRLGRAERAGQTLTCHAPQLTGDPTVTYVFAHQPADADGSVVIPRQPVQSGPSPRRALTLGDVGKQMVCIVVAVNAGGTASYASDDDSALALPIERSHTRPAVRIRSASCPRRRCVVSFSVHEKGSTAGSSAVTARAGRTSLSVRSLGHGRYRATGRAAGGQTVRVRAVSAASGRSDSAQRRVR